MKTPKKTIVGTLNELRELARKRDKPEDESKIPCVVMDGKIYVATEVRKSKLKGRWGFLLIAGKEVKPDADFDSKYIIVAGQS